MSIKARATGALLAAILSTTAFHGAFAADDTIKVGILHSLSGTMAISETTLKDAMLMLIEEQNKKGGRSSPKRRASLFRSTRSPPSSVAGRRFRANRCCRSSRS